MSITFRQFAVSGSAAVAILGGAAAVTMATPSPASAATQHVAHRAVTAPVTLPDGRTIRITGMGGYGHTATEAHVVTVAAFKTDSTSTGNTPAGSGAGTILQNPYNSGQTTTGYNQQITTQSASSGVMAVGTVTILLLAVIVIYKIKHGGLKVADAVLGVVAGVAVSGTFLGPTITQVSNSLVTSFGSALSSLG
ncbi:hypothetical protein ACFWPQ_01845 [Streptomyces sp. NPDC058464]|uniref:hypothetical protein n=1 Tax=Streptomyces sp. NPDC058464 TaxID=3346511 RepID=UPI00364BC2F6